jgi:hypothetical protein
MKRETRYTLIGIAIIVAIVIILNPDFEGIRNFYSNIKENLIQNSENRYPSKDFSKKFDKTLIVNSLVGVPEFLSSVKTYQIDFSNETEDQIFKTVIYNFNQSGLLILKATRQKELPDMLEKFQYESGHLEKIFTYSNDSCLIQEKRFTYKDEYLIKMTTKYYESENKAPLINTDTIIYLRHKIRSENDSTIRYFDKLCRPKKIFIRPARLRLPSFVINAYNSNGDLGSQSYKLSEYDKPSKNTLKKLWKNVICEIAEPKEREINNNTIAVFKTFNDFPFNSQLQPEYDSFDIAYEYLETDNRDNWKKIKAQSTDKNLIANITIDYY